MYGIVANVLSDKVLRTGAKVWINYCNGDAEHPIVHGISKNGRIVRKYIAYKRLSNFRAAWVPDHVTDRVAWSWPTREEAAAVAEKLAGMWYGVRFFSRDGKTLLRNGKTSASVFQESARLQMDHEGERRIAKRAEQSFLVATANFVDRIDPLSGPNIARRAALMDNGDGTMTFRRDLPYGWKK